MQTKDLQPKKALRAALFFLLLSVVGMTKANPVDMQTAREVAMKFINANTRVPLRGEEDLQLVTTYKTESDDAAFHIFNTPNGFVIVSADDCATPILGYSDEGQFDTENIPIQLQDYLQGFVEQIQYGIEKNHFEADEQTIRQWELVRTVGRLTNNRSNRTVEPLLTTKWNQDYPYNIYVPNGCPTGCTATAMAQVMKYWDWPIQGAGVHSYQWNGQTLSANFGETTYDWDNMLDDYDNNPGTQEQKEAVATLMWHCGVSVNMDYSPSGSGALLNPNSMIYYFRYSNEMSYEYSRNFPDAIWEAKLKDCLNLGRPLYYTGYQGMLGHAFVCDGYDVNDMFHFNWGWGGVLDGYFAVGALNVGGFQFNSNNAAMFNIHPQGETTTYSINVSIYNDEGGTVSGGGTVAHGDNVTLIATADEGYGFCYWEENGGIVSTNPIYSFTANYNREIVAVFAGPFAINTLSTEGGVVSGNGSYYYGETCLVTATANEGYCFAFWTENDNVVSYNANYSFVVTSARQLNAHFVLLEDNIVFADPNVKTICVANWDSNGDGVLSYSEASAVTSIGEVFRNHTEITSFKELQYFNSLTSIGKNAFYGCSGLIAISIPNSVTVIGNYAFYNCSRLTGTLIIPNGVISIGNNAFSSCSRLTSIVISNSVNSINSAAFSSCNSLTSLIVLAETPPVLASNTFINVPTSIPVYVPCGSEEAYQTMDGWSNFPNIMGLCLPGTITVDTDSTEGGIAVGAGTYMGGTSCVVTAIPNEGYSFANWTENGKVVSVDADYSFIVTNDRQLVANFVIEDNIVFADANVKTICLINWDTNSDGELSYGEAASMMRMGEVFKNHTEITSFDELQYFISLIAIDNSAFSGCSGLTSLTIPNTVTLIGSSAFSGCNGLTSLTIPNSVTSIGSYAFSGCSSLTGDLTIPNSVTSIGSYAFYNCSGLTGNLTISNSVTSIGNYAFYNCSGLTGNLTIPNSVTSIGKYAFQKCSGFTGNLTISNSVISIGSYAFSGCSSLTGSLTIPNSVTTIGEGAFYYCKNLNGTLTIPNSVISIGRSAFSGCSSLTGLTIPNSVTTIEYGTFSSCMGLKGSLVIPNSVTSIGDYAFSFCIGLTGTLTISNSVGSIGKHAFWNCISLTSMVILTETPPTLGTEVFYNVSTSIPVFVPCGSVETYQAMDGWNSFANIMDLCMSGTITVMADPIEGGEVAGAGTYESGTFCTVTATPNEGYRFANWIENGNVVSYDANHSFVVTGESLLTAHFVLEGNIVFADDKVKTICVSNWDTNGDGELSYIEAASVTTLSVVNIGEIFSGNTDITSFDELKYFVGLTSIGNNAFRYCSNLMALPTLPSTITSIGNSAFSGCGKMKGLLTLPNAITSIGSSAFSGCSGLIGPLNIPNSVTSIGASAFYMCSGITGALVIPDSVTLIGSSAFYDCGGLIGSVTIPNTITSINSCLFYWCDGLTSMTIPNSVTSIGASAFSNCRGLTSIIILAETPPAVASPSDAFYGVPKTIPIYVPCESIEAYQASEDWSLFSNFVGMCSSGTVTVAADPVDGGEVTGAGTYESGTTCTVTATSNEGYTFMHWTVNGVVASTQAEYTFTVPTDCNLVAHFTLPLCITATANPTEGGTVSEGEAYYEYGSLVTLTASVDEGFLFNSWKKGGEVLSYFSDYSFIVTENADFEAYFEPAPQGILIGEHTASNGNLPCTTYSYYSLSQQIYMADEIGMACEISSVSFFNTSQTKYLNWDVYLVHTNKVAFDSSTDWIPVTESDLVFSGNVTMSAGCWTTINFDTLFEYDGISNLALVVDNNTGSWTGSVSLACQTFNTIGNQSINVASSTNYDPYNPSNYYGSRWSEKNRIIFGAIPSTTQQTITLSQGWNWFSTYIEATDPIALLDMLKTALGDNALQIESQNSGLTIYENGEWFGNLDEVGIYNEQMYLIEVITDCTIQLQGMPANPANHEITINPGWNWIGFPYAEEMTIAEAFANFQPEEEDVIESSLEQAMYLDGEWISSGFETLTPGQGFLYFSNSTETKTLTFQTRGIKTQ